VQQDEAVRRAAVHIIIGLLPAIALLYFWLAGH
jgi:hypothetical protein